MLGGGELRKRVRTLPRQLLRDRVVDEVVVAVAREGVTRCERHPHQIQLCKPLAHGVCKHGIDLPIHPMHLQEALGEHPASMKVGTDGSSRFTTPTRASSAA